MSEPPQEAEPTPADGSSEPPVPAEDADRAPGWYPDPDGSGWRRYWDGQGWSSASPEQLAEESGGAPAGRGRTVAGAVVVAVVIIAVATVILATSSSGSHSHQAAAVSTTTAARPPTSTRATTTAPSTTTSATASVTAIAVTGPAITKAVDAYVAAYNARSIRQLGALFSPQLVRRTGAGEVQNLARALVVYSGQFAAETTPQLALAGVYVVPGAGQGGAGARFGVYAHGHRTRGTISFHFTQTGSRLLIDRLDIRDH